MEKEKEKENEIENELINKMQNLSLNSDSTHFPSEKIPSSRIPLCPNKETQINNLIKIDPNNSEKYKNYNTQNFPTINFEQENNDNNSNKKEEEEIKNQENIEKEENNINEEKKEIQEKKEKEFEKPQKPKQPLFSKGKLTIPLKTKHEYKNEDFEIISLTGKGAYGTVLKAKLKSDSSNKLYAIKVMDIKALTHIKKLYQAYLECDILSQISNPYIVDILGAFNEHGKIYIVMEYLSKGDFSDFIRLNYPLKLDTIQFYSAEIVKCLEYLQSKNIVHRDLKPENIMMNEKWHIQFIDFATARILGKYFDKENMQFKTDENYYDISETDDLKGNKIAINDDFVDQDDDLMDLDDIKTKPERRGMTFVGTAEYISPEVLGDKPAGFAADIWTLGIMIYQMFYGKTPFKEKTNYLIFRKIDQLKIDFNNNNNKVNIPLEAKDLITKILVKDPSKRLGAGASGSEYDINHLKSHPFFKGIDWDNLPNIKPPNCENFDFLLKDQKNKSNSIILSKETIKKVNEINKDNKDNNNNNIKDTIIKEGELDKKSPWLHYYKRKVILYSTPKFVWIDPSNNKIKGEIYLDKSVKVIRINMNIFDIVSTKKNYRFKTTNGEALIWEKMITDAIKKSNK